eukprot:scaffold100581_cov66-Phaeocystis_antarctica.AAC.1
MSPERLDWNCSCVSRRATSPPGCEAATACVSSTDLRSACRCLRSCICSLGVRPKPFSLAPPAAPQPQSPQLAETAEGEGRPPWPPPPPWPSRDGGAAADAAGPRATSRRPALRGGAGPPWAAACSRAAASALGRHWSRCGLRERGMAAAAAEGEPRGGLTGLRLRPELLGTRGVLGTRGGPLVGVTLLADG